MARSARSTLARLSLLLAPLCASLFIGLGFGIACTPDAGSDCSPGTTNCNCAPGGQCYPGLVCLAGFCVMGSGDGDGEAETGGDGESGDAGDGDGDNPCEGGEAFCGGKCVDTQTNILHCGDCDIACASDELCYEGNCATDCTEAPCEGLTWCDPDTSLCLPGCADDFQCGSNEMCDQATHECTCAFGYELCAGECIYEGDPCADNCGNGTVDVGETCDGNDLNGYTCVDFGFLGGTLECLPDCSDYDQSNCSDVECGNGIVEIGEECDGVNLDGETCVSQGFDGGTLSCTNCSFNTNNCSNDQDGGTCCVAHAEVGCSVQGIEDCVCAQDAYCCNTQWDGMCVTQAINDCGASC
jgi:hypothetical protein